MEINIIDMQAMNEIIPNIVSALIGGLLTWLSIKYISAINRNIRTKATAPKITRRIGIAVRYLAVAAIGAGIFALFSLSKLFVVFMCVVFLILSLMISYDYMTNVFESVLALRNKEAVKQEKTMLLNNLANCDRNEKDRIKKIMDRLNEIDG